MHIYIKKKKDEYQRKERNINNNTHRHTSNEVQCKLTDTVQLKATESIKLKGEKQYNELNKMLEEKERLKICGIKEIITVMQKNMNDVTSTNYMQ